MTIKWPIVILCGLGLAAALSAALLVTFWTARPIQGIVEQLPDPEVPVLIATRDIPAMTALREEDIGEKMVDRGSTPDGHFSDATQLIGRRPTSDIVDGQALTALLFPLAGSGLDLAGTLSDGMRAVSVAMGSDTGLVGLLYPGSRVDILATFSLGGQSDLGTAVSTTLLKNIEVLAVQGLTAAAAQRQADGAPSAVGPMITVLVTNEQAQFLHLATQNGRVSMAMRNPVDSAPVETEGTILVEGNIASLADVLSVSGKEEVEELAEILPEPVVVERPTPPPSPPPNNLTVNVIRGTVSESYEFAEELR